MSDTKLRELERRFFDEGDVSVESELRAAMRRVGRDGFLSDTERDAYALTGDEDAAITLAAILDGKVDPETVEAVEDWIRQCYNRPSHEELVMCAADALAEGFGVEAVFDSDGDVACSYVNTGDTYNLTLLYDHGRDEFQFTTWGDWIETTESLGVISIP